MLCLKIYFILLFKTFDVLFGMHLIYKIVIFKYKHIFKSIVFCVFTFLEKLDILTCINDKTGEHTFNVVKIKILVLL